MVNVGLVTGVVTPSARQAARTNVVLPVPISPRTSTTSPGRNRAASSSAAAPVASGLELLIGRAQAQAGTGQQQRQAGKDDQARIAARVGQRARRDAGGHRARRAGGRARRRRAAAQVRVLREPVVARGARAARLRARRGRAAAVAVGERIVVLIVPGAAGALAERPRGQGKRRGGEGDRDAPRTWHCRKGIPHDRCLRRDAAYTFTPRMADPLHILVLGSAPRAGQWRAEGHRVTEVAGRRSRVAWRTWRGAGRDADVVLEIVDGQDYLSPLWGWIDAP